MLSFSVERLIPFPVRLRHSAITSFQIRLLRHRIGPLPLPRGEICESLLLSSSPLLAGPCGILSCSALLCGEALRSGLCPTLEETEGGARRLGPGVGLCQALLGEERGVGLCPERPEEELPEEELPEEELPEEERGIEASCRCRRCCRRNRRCCRCRRSPDTELPATTGGLGVWSSVCCCCSLGGSIELWAVPGGFGVW